MEWTWIKENSEILMFFAAVIGWFVRLEVRLTSAATKKDLAEALSKIYDRLAPMGENVAYIKGQLDKRKDEQ